MKRLMILLLVLSILLAACGGEKTEKATQPSSQTASEPDATEEKEPTKKKSEGFSLAYLPKYGVNPFTCTATVNRALLSLLYESLFTVSEQFRAEPVLCKTFRMSEDGKNYVFSIIDGACFSDGTPITSADLEASIQAARSSSFYKARLSHISYYVTQNDGTLLIVLDTPYENFPLMLDIPVVKKETIENEVPIGSGQYCINGNRLIRNTHWKQSEEPVLKLETIPLTACTDTNTLRDEFEFGSSDLVYCDPNSAASVGYRCDYEVWEAPTTVLHYIGFNLYSGYFANATLRKAVTYMLDREKIASDFYNGFALPSSLPCSPYSDLYDNQLAERYDFDAESFRTGLKDSGVLTSSEYENYSGIFLVCSDDRTRVEAAKYIAQQLTEAGLRITVSAVDHDAYLKQLNGGDFDLYYGETRLTPNFDLSEFFNSNGNLQYGSIKNTALSALCTSALENTGTYVELCSQLMQEAPICPVVFKSYAVYVTRGKLSNLTPSVDHVFHDSATARLLSDADNTYNTMSTE